MWANEPLSTRSTAYVPLGDAECATQLHQSCSFLGLDQLYPAHPTEGYTLDLLFAPSAAASVIELNDPLVSSDVHHVPSYFRIEVGRGYAAHSDDVIRRKFAGADFALINQALSKIDWNVNLCHGTVEDNIKEFYRLVNNVVGEFVPLRVGAPSQYPCWCNAELIKLIKLKKH